jgi:hypothetical protein
VSINSLMNLLIKSVLIIFDTCGAEKEKMSKFLVWIFEIC